MSIPCVVGPNGKLPKKDKGNAGYDLYSSMDDFWLNPGEVQIVDLDIIAQLPENTCAILMGRSGLATKGIDPLEFIDPENNRVLGGLIDSSYRGKWGVILKNLGASPIQIERGDRIAQCVILEHRNDPFVQGSVDDTSRGSKGFGSSGK